MVIIPLLKDMNCFCVLRVWKQSKCRNEDNYFYVIIASASQVWFFHKHGTSTSWVTALNPAQLVEAGGS